MISKVKRGSYPIKKDMEVDGVNSENWLAEFPHTDSAGIIRSVA